MKVLFIHGLASSGAYKAASSLRILLRPCDVIAPDVPIEPDAALALLRGICRDESPDLIVGHSLGGFWAQQLRGYRRILINPDFHVAVLMRYLEGEQKYLSPRRDGATTFTITDAIAGAYAELEKRQFDGIDDADRALVTGMFAQQDELVRDSPTFLKHYPGRAIFYPGGHMPTYPELKNFLVPLVTR